MKEFEYKIERILPKWSFNEEAMSEESLARLNEMGAEGWELVDLDYFKLGALFKRELAGS